MSGVVRRLEKRIMKRAGYTREKWIIVETPSGKLEPREVKRRGEITDPDDNPIGRRWPTRIPARAKFPTRSQPKHINNPRALRRSKKTKRWLAARER